MSEAPDQRAKRPPLLLLGATCAFVASVVAVSSSAFQVRYCQWRMQRAWDETFAQTPDVQNGLVSYRLGASYDRYLLYRQQLVGFGAVRELHYRMRHIKRSTGRARDFIDQLVHKNCPSLIDFESPYVDRPAPLELTVWCYAVDAETWDQFIADHDVADPS
jgi:hypothetical protein